MMFPFVFDCFCGFCFSLSFKLRFTQLFFLVGDSPVIFPFVSFPKQLLVSKVQI